MSAPHRDEQARPDPSFRSAEELGARRLAWRRRRSRRPALILTVLAAVLSLSLMLLLTAAGGSPPHTRAGRPALRTMAATARRPARTANRRTGRGREARSVARVLAYTPYVQLAGHRKREVALTFDDGPSPFTRQIIQILVRAHTPATFFVIGREANTYPQLVAAEARQRFEIGDHTETHAFLSLLPPAAQALQIEQAAQAIHRATGTDPRLFRPPYGSFDQATLDLLRSRRMLMVLWSVDTKDYERPGAAKIAYTAISGARPGAIILMYDGGGDRSQTVAALPGIIRRLRQRHFRFVTVSQLVADDPPPTHQPPPRPLSGRG